MLNRTKKRIETTIFNQIISTKSNLTLCKCMTCSAQLCLHIKITFEYEYHFHRSGCGFSSTLLAPNGCSLYFCDCHLRSLTHHWLSLRCLVYMAISLSTCLSQLTPLIPSLEKVGTVLSTKSGLLANEQGKRKQILCHKPNLGSFFPSCRRLLSIRPIINGPYILCHFL